MRAFPLALLAVLVVFGAPSRAFDIRDVRAEYTVTSWTEKDGMPSSYVRAIAQDKDGYLWLATYSGLLKFDGQRFVARPMSDGVALPSDDLSALLIARDGTLWIGGVVGGVTHVNGGRTSSYRSSPDGLFDGYVFALAEDDRGTIWAAAQGGLARFDGAAWQGVGPERGLPRRPALSLHHDSQGTLWVGTSVGLYLSRPPYEHFEAVSSLSHPIEDIVQGPDGEIAVTDPASLFRLLTRQGSPTVDSPRMAVHGTRLLHDRRGDLWVGTRGHGIARVKDAAQRGHAGPIEHLTHTDGLSSDSVLALFEDREGNVWVGTPFGLNRLSHNSVIPVPMPNGVAGQVRAVTSAPDGVWAATAETLLHFSHKGETLHEASGMAAATINALYHDRQQKILWISTDRGVVRYADGRFSAFTLPDGTALTRVRSITTDTQGRLWLCDGDRGVFRSRDSTLSTFDVVSEDKPASSVYASRSGTVWIGLVNGTIRRIHGNLVESYSEEHGLPGGGTITAIHEDSQGTIWVGTHRGLSRFDSGRFVTLSRSGGLPGPGPVALADDDEGNLWLGVTGVGVLQTTRKDFDRAVSDRTALQYRLFTETDGLRATPVRWLGTPTSARAADGTLWFLTGNGLAVVDPKSLREPRQPTHVRIEAIVADEKEFAPAPQLTLPPNTTTLQIQYALASLAPVSHVRFRYKLEGLDASWIDAAGRRQAFYTNLSPGRYRFVVEATSDGLSRATTASWPFAIQPRFYQTPWFAIAGFAGVAVGLWGLWHLRLRQVQRRFALVLDERARMGREIHDTLLQGLVGVAMQFKIIGDHLTTSPDLARERLERLRKLVEHYISETRQSIWDLRSPSLQSADLPAALRASCETMTSPRGIKFDMTVTGAALTFPAKTEEQILRIGREAVANAVRHADPSVVRLELRYDARELVLRVTDDGSGFDVTDPAFADATHWGLESMRERAQQMNAQLIITTHPGAGTQLTLSVPTTEAKKLWATR